MADAAAEPTTTEIDTARDQTGYTYTDPVDDPQWRRITAPSGAAPDAFPPGWGAAPTERDQVAINAGNC